MKDFAKILVCIFVIAAGGLSGSPLLASEENSESRTVSETLSESGEQTNKNKQAEMEQETVQKENEEKPDTEFMEERSMFSILLQLFAALAFVIGIMYFLLKFLHKRTRQYQSHQTLQNLGGVPLGQNKSVQVVKVGERLLVVGVGESIQLLKEIDKDEEMEQFLETEKQPAASSWNETRAAFLEKFKKPKASVGGVNHSSSKEKEVEEFHKVFEEQLEEMKKTRKLAHQQLKEFDS